MQIGWGSVRRAAIAGAVLFGLVGAVQASPVAAEGGGNSAAAHACQDEGWKNLATSSGQSFVNEGDCVSYAARGGVLAQKPIATLTVAFTGCFIPEPGFIYCATGTVVGSGLAPFATITATSPTGETLTLSGYVGADGSVNLGRSVAEPGVYYPHCSPGAVWSAPTASGGTIQTEPVPCPGV